MGFADLQHTDRLLTEHLPPSSRSTVSSFCISKPLAWLPAPARTMSDLLKACAQPDTSGRWHIHIIARMLHVETLCAT